jgi:putative sterol carrier protein
MNDVVSEFADLAPKLAGLGGIICFDLGEDGTVTVDARGTPEVLTEAVEADCTIKISLDNMRKLALGKLDPMLAYGMGKIRVTGSLPLAMKLAGAIG